MSKKTPTCYFILLAILLFLLFQCYHKEYFTLFSIFKQSGRDETTFKME
jgi:hypothetical protein